MTAPAIEVEGLCKTFRRVHQASTIKRAAIDLVFNPQRRVDYMEALVDVSFAVGTGEAVGVIGRNGSGKSTILTLLAGIYRPSAGRITVRGRIGSLLDLAAGFHPEMTAEDNALLNAMIHGLGRREAAARVPAMIEFAGLGSFADTKMKHFSSGMFLRLGFAVVAHTDPEVLLVDEILAVGDEAFQRRCRQMLSAHQASGKTLVFVSHHLPSIEEVCRRVIWLDGGRVRMDGPTAEVLAAYRTAMAD